MKTSTYLPVFSGFYGTYWESDETSEIDYINERRQELGLPEINYDDCEFDYKEYELKCVKEFIGEFENEFKRFITSIEFQKIVSPREYNFRNDSVDVIIELSDDNVKEINKYLIEHNEAFAKYLHDSYTSCSGFISSYPNTIDEFIGSNLEKALEHSHKLGSILNFIARNEDSDIELTLYYRCNDLSVQCTNFDELVPETTA